MYCVRVSTGERAIKNCKLCANNILSKRRVYATVPAFYVAAILAGDKVVWTCSREPIAGDCII